MHDGKNFWGQEHTVEPWLHQRRDSSSEFIVQTWHWFSVKSIGFMWSWMRFNTFEQLIWFYLILLCTSLYSVKCIPGTGQSNCRFSPHGTGKALAMDLAPAPSRCRNKGALGLVQDDTDCMKPRMKPRIKPRMEHCWACLESRETRKWWIWKGVGNNGKKR